MEHSCDVLEAGLVGRPPEVHFTRTRMLFRTAKKKEEKNAGSILAQVAAEEDDEWECDHVS